MDKKKITACLEEINEALQKQGLSGEICLYGGAVMCLVYEARPSTKDVDAIFKPSREIREIAKNVGNKNGLGDNWLNDAVKGFLVEHKREVLFDFSNLKVYVPEPDYLLAMKALASRVDSTDGQDIRFLVKKLGIKTPQEAFNIVEKYYPRQRIKPATQFFIEEILEK